MLTAIQAPLVLSLLPLCLGVARQAVPIAAWWPSRFSRHASTFRTFATRSMLDLRWPAWSIRQGRSLDLCGVADLPTQPLALAFRRSSVVTGQLTSQAVRQLATVVWAARIQRAELLRHKRACRQSRLRNSHQGSLLGSRRCCLVDLACVIHHQNERQEALPESFWNRMWSRHHACQSSNACSRSLIRVLMRLSIFFDLMLTFRNCSCILSPLHARHARRPRWAVTSRHHLTRACETSIQHFHGCLRAGQIVPQKHIRENTM